MVIHPNAGWAGVIWGRSEGGKGVGGGGRVAAGWGASGDSGAVRHKNENNFYRNKIVSKFVIFLRRVYGYTYALLYGTAWKLAPHSSAPHSKMNKLSIPHAARAFNIVTSIICKRKQTQYKTKLL